jgi:hypothetical protein
MRPLPTISQVMSMVRQETASAQATKQASAPAPVFSSEIARGLHDVAEIVKAAADASVTYDEVLVFGRTLLGGGK